MEALDTPGYQPGGNSQSVEGSGLTDDQVRELLTELISSSADLNVRVWLDGVYTDIDDTQIHGEWMKGREIYFKVEGKVEGSERPNGQSEARRD
jgi:hypothetical protein